MSGVAVKVESRDVRAAVQALTAVDKQVAAEWRRRAKSEIAEPWARDLRNHAPKGRKGRAAGESIQAAGGAKPAIIAGKGSWPGDHGQPWQPFFAMNYGMHRGAYTSYTRRTKRGGRVAVRRRVRTWALRHRAKGYWLERAITRTQPEYRRMVMFLVDDVIRETLQ